MSKQSTSSGGMGFTSALLLVFITLKLTNIIDWSWWWVLSPVWISFILFLIIVGGYGIWLSIKIKKGEL